MIVAAFNFNAQTFADALALGAIYALMAVGIGLVFAARLAHRLGRIRFLATDFLPLALLGAGLAVWLTRRNK